MDNRADEGERCIYKSLSVYKLERIQGGTGCNIAVLKADCIARDVGWHDVR